MFGLQVVGAFYDFVYDIGRSLRQSREELIERIESASGEQAYAAVRREGKGAILLTAHMGSFEVGLVALAANEPRIHVVFKRDEVGAFEKLRSELRGRLQVLEAPIDDGWMVWLRLRNALLNNEVVAIQGDRAMPGQKGVKTPLLDGHVLLPTGPFKLAVASGSPIVPIFSVRTESGGVRIFLEEAIYVESDEAGVANAVQKFADVLGQYIRRYPDQWLVLDRAFCEDNEGGIEAAGAAAAEA